MSNDMVTFHESSRRFRSLVCQLGYNYQKGAKTAEYKLYLSHC